MLVQSKFNLLRKKNSNAAEVTAPRGRPRGLAGEFALRFQLNTAKRSRTLLQVPDCGLRHGRPFGFSVEPDHNQGAKKSEKKGAGFGSNLTGISSRCECESTRQGVDHTPLREVQMMAHMSPELFEEV